MMGILGWSPEEVWPLTLREFILAYEAKIVNDWDHTASLSALIHNLSVIVIQLSTKNSKAKAKSMTHFHPFRDKKKQGLKINRSNIGDLKAIGALMARR